MSDKFLYALARPLLFSLDPESAHNLTLPALRSAAALGLAHFLPTPKADPRTVMGITFPNPVGLAAGFALGLTAGLAADFALGLAADFAADFALGLTAGLAFGLAAGFALGLADGFLTADLAAALVGLVGLTGFLADGRAAACG